MSTISLNTLLNNLKFLSKNDFEKLPPKTNKLISKNDFLFAKKVFHKCTSVINYLIHIQRLQYLDLDDNITKDVPDVINSLLAFVDYSNNLSTQFPDKVRSYARLIRLFNKPKQLEESGI